jgi:hypothetical protein
MAMKKHKNPKKNSGVAPFEPFRGYLLVSSARGF